MNETTHCWKCHADLAGHKLRCPSCGVRQAGPPPLPTAPEESQKLNWLVDIAIFLAAPASVWVATTISKNYWLPAIFICPLIAAITLQVRWWKRTRKSLFADLLTLLLVGFAAIVPMVFLCFWGCTELLKGF
ncbi:MAG: hypothetical protein ACO1QS_12615 [Verrucomicrobiota bacterium]